MESELSDGTAAVPQILITEPSPMVHNTSVVSIAEKAGPAAEAKVVDSSYAVQNGTTQKQSTSDQATTEAKEQESNSSGEFTPAQECADCAVSVPELEPQVVEDARTACSETDQDDFRTASTAGCSSAFLACLEGFNRFWEIVDHRWRLPFWMILIALPLSAGVMGSLHMFSCPAADSLPSAIFSVGISLLAVLTIRICIVVHIMTCDESEYRHALVTMLLISTFVLVIFFVTESMMFWKMDSTPEPKSEKFCEPIFLQYAFWWNCVMCFAMVPILIAPC